MTAPRRTINPAKSLRGAMSLPEVALWARLGGGVVNGLRFRRQRPAGPYILDFYCAELRLAVEIDGMTHDARVEYDRRRDAWLTDKGIRVLRLPARLVLYEMKAALAAIEAAAR